MVTEVFFFIFLFLVLDFHCFFLAVNFVFLAWFLYGTPPPTISRCFLSFASLLSLCFGFLSSRLYCILYFFRVEFFSAPLFRPILDAFISLFLSSLDLNPSQYTRPLWENLHIAVSTLHVHGWAQQFGVLPTSLGEIALIHSSLCVQHPPQPI